MYNALQNRQLGYVTVTRPVRQGRLKLALEEVLMMQLDGGAAAHPHQVRGGGSAPSGGAARWVGLWRLAAGLGCSADTAVMAW